MVTRSELARPAGELRTVSDLIGMLQVSVPYEFLEERSLRLQKFAVDQLLRYTGVRALGVHCPQDQQAMATAEAADPEHELRVVSPLKPQSSLCGTRKQILKEEFLHD